jgi:hypothetical protein
MDDEKLLDRLTSALQELWDDGCPVVGSRRDEMARLALRRWRSGARRRVRPVIEDRMRDLTAGLIEAFEPEPRLVGSLKCDYRCVAERLARELTSAETNVSGVVMWDSRSQEGGCLRT